MSDDAQRCRGSAHVTQPARLLVVLLIPEVGDELEHAACVTVRKPTHRGQLSTLVGDLRFIVATPLAVAPGKLVVASSFGSSVGQELLQNAVEAVFVQTSLG